MSADPLLCPVCRSDKLTLVHRQTAVNDEVSFLDELTHCENCGESFYTYEQSMARSRARTAALRKADGLPTPEEIREIRASLGLSQAAFERALGTGKKTVVRWERGTIPPSRAACLALWLAQNHPDIFMQYANQRMPELRLGEDEKVVGKILAASNEASSPIVKIKKAGDWQDFQIASGGSPTIEDLSKEGLS